MDVSKVIVVSKFIFLSEPKLVVVSKMEYVSKLKNGPLGKVVISGAGTLNYINYR